MSLFSIESDAKTSKGSDAGVLTAVLYMAPSDVSGYQVCSMALPIGAAPDGIRSQCSVGCLYSAGMGVFQSTQDARIRRTRIYFEDRDSFMAQAVSEIKALVRRAAKLGMVPAVRCDGTSDLGIAAKLAPLFPDVAFYDYTKVTKRVTSDRPSNWHLTYSASELTTDETIRAIINRGVNVSMVFDTKKSQPLPTHYQGIPVIDGDLTDIRFRDPVGVIVGLRAKGKARKDATGFVRKVISIQSI